MFHSRIEQDFRFGNEEKDSARESSHPIAWSCSHLSAPSLQGFRETLRRCWMYGLAMAGMRFKK